MSSLINKIFALMSLKKGGDMSIVPTNEFPFIMTTTPNTKSFSFNIGAAGNFVIDWGDGNVEKIDKNKTGKQTISHSYNNAGAHKIKLGGKATEYDSHYTAISFYENLNLAKIDGSLGQIFSTLSDGTQPQFGTLLSLHGTFQGCTNLTGNIPAELFSGIYGAPASYMFFHTFLNCSNLSGSIPENLFARIKGTPACSMFESTFYGCSRLTGSIPENLFAGIKGAPARYMFASTFYGCSRLTGSIPENLFAGIEGEPASDMFDCTFDGCSRLSGTMDELGNIENEKAPSAVTATKKKSKLVVAPEFKPMPDMQTSNTLCVNISLSGNMIEKIPNLKSNIIGGVCSAYFAKNTNTDVQIKCDSVDDNKFTVFISEKQNGKQR